MKEISERLGMGSLVALLVTGVAFTAKTAFGPWLLALLAGLFIEGALWEYYQLAKQASVDPQERLGYCAALVLVVLAALNPLWLPVGVLGAFFSAFIYYLFTGTRVLLNLSVTMSGLLYIAWPLSYLIPLGLYYPTLWLFYLLLVTKLTDVGAYFVGTLWGKHPLAPQISPKKSWEGALGGLLTGIAVSLLFTSLFSGPLEAVVIGCCLSIVAQLGDLFESLLKRGSGVKDSNKIPGLGGFLDMVDSLIFTTCFLYGWLQFH